MAKKLNIPELNNPKWLSEQYEKKSLVQIADALGVARNTVRNCLIKYGIERRDCKEMLREIGKKPKSLEQREKMTIAARKRWKDSPMTDELRLRMSQGRRKDGDKASPYQRVFDLEYGEIHEHRLIMIRKLGRPLKSNEHVHHIDGNPRNNNPENLIVLTSREHASHHNVDRERDSLGRFKT